MTATLADAEAALADEETAALIIIPADFSDALLAGETVAVDFRVNGTANAVQIVETAVNKWPFPNPSSTKTSTGHEPVLVQTGICLPQFPTKKSADYADSRRLAA